MDTLQLIWEYTMPTLMALSILYFFYSKGRLSDAGSYSEEEEALSLIFSSLAVMFIVVNIWLVVMLSTAML